MELLQGLNHQQQQAVQASPGPILVLAGPGSGKTRVLTHRIAYLIGAMGVRPYNILAVTFTNKAAREMERRVQDLLHESSNGLLLGTFHATCARMLRREAEHLPFTSNFVIFDSDDQLSLVKVAIGDLNIDEKRYRPQALHNAISNAKNELLLPDDFPVETYRDEVARRVYKRYQDLLLVNNALDFDDLLLWTAYLFEENDIVRERYARRFEYVLVDEFQDTNLAQYRLLKHLASYHRNLYVVGDTDQSIYAWRGADYRNLLRFQEDYPDAQVILLEQNYRSTQLILDTAMAIIDRHPARIPKRLFTERGEGQKGILYEAEDDKSEAAFIVETIAAKVAKNTAQAGDFAIMYRTNAQSRVLEEAFLHAGLPYKLVGAQRFYGRREVKDVIAYLRLVHNPDDELSLTRIINTPTRGIGDKTVTLLRVLAQKNDLSPGRMLLELAQDGSIVGREALPSRSLAVLSAFAHMVQNWISHHEKMTPLEMMDMILSDVHYRGYIDDGTEEGEDRWDNVMELRRLAAEYAGSDLTSFLENVALVSDQDTLENGLNVPTLLTLHAAKGLEFPLVFITGLNDGTLPHSRSFDDPEGMLEERRLLYVGITRAKDMLYLSYTQNRSAYGYLEPCEPSRFLNDIPTNLLSEVSGRSRLRNRTRESQSYAWESKSSSHASVIPQAAIHFPAGTRVTHPSWGEGMVLNSRFQDDDEIIDIFFEQVGLKRVAASLAKLQVKE
jgi:DNA helicase-2/ATP-dependent DNA helicase PcrA